MCLHATQLFVEYGYHGTKMDAVAASTKLNKATLYFYYPSKADLLFEILDTVVTRIIGRSVIDPTNVSPIDGIGLLVRAIIFTIYELQPQTTVYFKEMPWIETILPASQVSALRAKELAFYAHCEKVFDRALKEGAIRPMKFADFFHAMMGVSSFAHRWIKKSSSPEDVATRVADLILYGIANASPAKAKGIPAA